MTSLRRWARAERDASLDWGDVEDELLDFIATEADYLLVSFSIHFVRAHARLARRVEDIVSEFRAPDPSTIRRWAGGGRS